MVKSPLNGWRWYTSIFDGLVFKGLLLCETMGTFGTFRYLSYLGHFWTIWSILDHFGPFLNKSRKTDWPPPLFEKVFLKILVFLNDGFSYKARQLTLVFIFAMHCQHCHHHHHHNCPHSLYGLKGHSHISIVLILNFSIFDNIFSLSVSHCTMRFLL